MPSREGRNGKGGRGKDFATLVTYQHNLRGDKAAKALRRRRRKRRRRRRRRRSDVFAIRKGWLQRRVKPAHALDASSLGRKPVFQVIFSPHKSTRSSQKPHVVGVKKSRVVRLVTPRRAAVWPG